MNLAVQGASLAGGTVIGGVIVGIILLVCIGWILYTLLFPHDDYWGKNWVHASIAAGIALITVGTWVWAMWPLKYDYHHWVPVEGNIQQINKRIVSNGDSGISQRFVVVMNGHPYGIDDTRATLLKVGDHVVLRCKKEHEWGTPLQANGWACRWAGRV